MTRLIIRVRLPGRGTSSPCIGISREDGAAHCTSGSPKPGWHEGQIWSARRWACCSMKALATRFGFRLRLSRAVIGAKEVYAACELLQALGCGRLRRA